MSNQEELVMSRVQLALRVSDLEGSIDFYRSLFGVEPAKRRPGYANFAIAEPPLKLVLIEGEPDRARCSTTSASRSRPPTR
jgi:catechol 2,3-dioxygenase-like lactoylglutathione lyase family enzyme